MVPWLATNQDHQLTLAIQDADNKDIAGMQLTFKAGRPPNIVDGAAQRIMFAVPFAVVFPEAGTYWVRGHVGEEERRVMLHVEIPPVFRMAPPAPPRQ
jgi:hypothetical protein